MDLGGKSKSASSRPFYKPPENKATSSQIISEAKSSLRSFNTRRPFTPREDQRHLFPASTNRTTESRPPSSFSLTSRHFQDGVDSRPVSGTRLSPLDHSIYQAPRTLTAPDLDSILPPKPPPTDPKQVRRTVNARQHRLHSQHSVDGALAAKDVLAVSHASGSLTDVSGGGDVLQADRPLRAHSGPKERTAILSIEEGGVGDVPKQLRHLSTSVASHPTSAGSQGSRDGDSRVSSGGSRHSSAGQTRAVRQDSESNDEFFKQQVSPILDKIATLHKKKDSEELLSQATDLFNLLEDNNCLGKHFRHRPAVLKVVFRLLDSEDTRLLIKLARLILTLRVGGTNLLQLCKLVFKISRDEKNDSFFLEENILNSLLDTIRNTDPSTSAEALIYCVGTVKFLTGNGEILKRLARLDCVKVLANLMHSINKMNLESGKVGDQFGHILVQLAAALRNLADTSSGRERFLNNGVVEGLVQLTESYPDDSDLILYISRILSKVTQHSDCCSTLAKQWNCYKSFVHLLQRHLRKEDLVVRMSFTLGNLAAKHEQARLRLFQEKDSFDTFILVLKTYNELDLQGVKTLSSSMLPDQGHTAKERSNKVEEVLAKTIRVLTNIMISEEVGHVIANNDDFVSCVLAIIERKDVKESEDLVMNCLYAVHNLTCHTVHHHSRVHQNVGIAELLVKFISASYTGWEGMTESVRIYGNITLLKPVRDFLSLNQVDVLLVPLMDSSDQELVYVACGSLVNFMQDKEKREHLKQENVVAKSIDVLTDRHGDWQLSMVVCKMLSNFSQDMTSTSGTFGYSEGQRLLEILEEYLDPDIALGSEWESLDEETQRVIKEQWENDFCPVASQLRDRIEAYQSPLEPLEAPG